MNDAETVEILNVLQPGKTYRVNKAKFEAMKLAVLKVLPKSAQGMSVADLGKGVLPHLPQSLFPGGATSGWWVKAVQLDLEARNIIGRTKTKPLRLHKI